MALEVATWALLALCMALNGWSWHQRRRLQRAYDKLATDWTFSLLILTAWVRAGYENEPDEG